MAPELNFLMRLEKKKFEAFPSETDLMDIIMHTSSTVWNNELLKKNIDKWLNNFTGEVFNIEYEHLIALWLLSHYTFYNQNEVNHLCKVVYQELIHLVLSKQYNLTNNPSKLVNDFYNKTNIIASEKTSGSGGFIAYFFRHSNLLPMSLFNFSVDNIGENVENVVVIDDVTLTAGVNGQMYKFLHKYVNKYQSKKFFLITLIASESSIKYLENTFNIEVVTAIKLDARDKCFSAESDIFSPFPELIHYGREFATHYGSKILYDDPLGFKDGQYTFGFFYNTPDNTLPIFWGQENGWFPIVKRYAKNYGDQKYLGNEQFI